MNRIFIIGCITIAISGCFPRSVPAEPDPLARIITAGGLNGQGWLQLSDFERGAYMVWFSDAFRFSKAISPGVQEAKDFFMPIKADKGDVRNGITQFYLSDSVNLALPIPIAIRIYTMKTKGATTREIDEYRADMMKAFFPYVGE